MIPTGALAPVIPLFDRAEAMPAVTPRVSAGLPLAVVAVAALGLATQVNFGQFAPTAMAPLGVAVVACVMAMAATRRAVSARLAWAIIVTALTVQFSILLTQLPCATWPAGAEHELLVFRALVLAGAACTIAALIARGRVATIASLLLLLAYLAAGLCVLRVVPQPGVDVCMFQRDAADALMAGRNPYAITFADPYGPASGFYGEDVIRDGRTTWGYPYPPLPLILATPGHLLGDFRLALLGAMTLSGALLLFMRPGSRLGVAAAGLMLFTPRGFFALEAGWIEPFVILGLAATVLFAQRCRPIVSREDAGWRRKAPGAVAEFKPRASGALHGWLPLAIAAGLFLATKQYLALAIPLLWLLPAFRSAPVRWKALAVVAIAGAVVTLPLMLWDLRAFVTSVVTLQFHQPFRPDALSFLVPLAGSIGRTPPAWIPFALAGLVIVIAMRRAPRTPAGFAFAIAAVFVVFFAFNKQAFCNYYHFVIGALCCAVAATPLPPADRVRENPAA